MESRPESTNINPYATPKTASTIDQATYLSEDGYAFKDELIANKHFKPPLICAKLGISLENEKSPQQTLLTVRRISSFSGPMDILVTSFCIFIGFIVTICTMNNILLGILAAYLLKNRVFSKPYQIPFYFSEKYRHIRKKHIIIDLSILTLFTIGFFYGLQGSYAIIFICVLGFIITLFFLKFHVKYFIFGKSSGDFLYLREAHPNFLKMLPILPISNKP